MSAETPILPESFFQPVLDLGDANDRLRWYMCVLINLSSVNYPDVIPQVYAHLDANVLSALPTDEARRQAINRVREGLIKSTGIVGAARTGNAMRMLSTCVPEMFRETESLRSKETEETARERGRKFWTNIYARNPAFDPEASVRASPDYAFVVRGMSIPALSCFHPANSVGETSYMPGSSRLTVSWTTLQRATPWCLGSTVSTARISFSIT